MTQNENNELIEHELKENSKMKNFINSAAPVLGLGIYQFGYACNLCLGATIWPKQIEMIVPPGSKELMNGLIGIPSTLANTFLPPLAGALSDKFHFSWGKRHPLMLSGFLFSALWAVVCAIFIFPWRSGSSDISFALLCVFSTLCWIGLSTGVGAFTGLVPDTVPENRLGLAAGILGIGRSLGNLLSVLIAGFVIQFVPYPWNFFCAYLAFSLVLVWTSLYTFVTVPEAPPKPNPEPFNMKEFVMSFFLWPPTEYYNFYCVFISRWFFQMGTYSIINYLQYYLQDVFEDPYATLGSSLLIACVLLIGVIVSPFAGFASDYIPRKWIVVLACMFTTIVVVINMLLTLFKGPLWMVYVACATLGIGVGIYYAVDWALGIDAIPRKENIAKDMGLWHVSDTVPSMIAPLITGVLIDSLLPRIGIRGAWATAFGFSAFWYCLSSIAVMFIYIKPKKDREREEIPLSPRENMKIEAPVRGMSVDEASLMEIRLDESDE